MTKTINEIAMEQGQRALDRLTQALADADTVAQLRGDLLAERDAEVIAWMQKEKQERTARIAAEARLQEWIEAVKDTATIYHPGIFAPLTPAENDAINALLRGHGFSRDRISADFGRHLCGMFLEALRGREGE